MDVCPRGQALIPKTVCNTSPNDLGASFWMIRAVKHNHPRAFGVHFKLGRPVQYARTFGQRSRRGWAFGVSEKCWTTGRHTWATIVVSHSRLQCVDWLTNTRTDCVESVLGYLAYFALTCIMSQAQVSGCSWSTAGCSQARISGATSLPRPTSSTRSRRTMCTRGPPGRTPLT